MTRRRGGTWRDQAGVTLVELLVVVVLLGVVATATSAVVIGANRAEQFQDQLQSVVDDGRLALARIRQELRAARRVHDTSCHSDSSQPCEPSDRLHFWVDQDQDKIPDADEQVCYVVEQIGTGQWQLLRWTDATAGCDVADKSGKQWAVLAKTLVDPEPFRMFDDIDPDAAASDPVGPQTRSVVVRLDLEVVGGRGPRSVAVEATVRLRNVE